MNTRPFRILGVQQIAVGASDRALLHVLWVDMLGLHSQRTFQSEKENVDEEILTIGSGTLAVELDLMQPLDPDKKPRVDVPALNHIGLWVDNLKECVTWLTAQGMRFAPGGIRKGASGHDVCFIHPRASDEFPLCGNGVLIELVQAPPEVQRQSTSSS
jgi:lactoylglutathione lyase